jgi:hypothetical protein
MARNKGDEGQAPLRTHRLGTSQLACELLGKHPVCQRVGWLDDGVRVSDQQLIRRDRQFADAFSCGVKNCVGDCGAGAGYSNFTDAARSD